MYVYIKLATVVEGDLKAPFSIAATPRHKGGCYSFPWISYPWYVPYNTYNDRYFLSEFQNNNVERAVDWALSHAAELDAEMETDDGSVAAAEAQPEYRDGSGSK